LGDHVGDVPNDVEANRRVLAADIGRPVQFLHQMHCWDVHEVASTTPVHPYPDADAAVTVRDDVALAVMVADCLPILLADTAARAVGVAHAGWRGLLGVNGYGVVEAVVASIRQRCESEQSIKKCHPSQYPIEFDATKITAFLGPCIGPRHFEVGDEVRQAFVAAQPHTARCFRALGAVSAGRWLADLPALVRHRLGSVGVHSIHGNDGSDDWCTVSQPARFFSHRWGQRHGGAAGRQAACIWLMRGG
jgi:copper oxidase (laccase) domain-containing protein